MKSLSVYSLGNNGNKDSVAKPNEVVSPGRISAIKEDNEVNIAPTNQPNSSPVLKRSYTYDAKSSAKTIPAPIRRSGSFGRLADLYGSGVLSFTAIATKCLILHMGEVIFLFSCGSTFFQVQPVTINQYHSVRHPLILMLCWGELV